MKIQVTDDQWRKLGSNVPLVHLIADIAGDEPQTAPLLKHMSMHKRFKPMLEWLLKNQLTGKKLVDTVKGDFNGSHLLFINYVDSKVLRTSKEAMADDYHW